jgi:translation elongation factor EF-1alpha
MDLLRFITAGSVDDGKSTLIGRLLYDSKSILADQLEAIEKQSKNKQDGEIDLALLTDGLRAEESRASRSISLINTSALLTGSLSLLMHRDIFNIPATWLPCFKQRADRCTY